MYKKIKNIPKGIWTACKEIYKRPRYTFIAIAVLGMAANLFMQTSVPHRLLIAETWADITTFDGVYVNQNASSTPETTEAILKKIAKCESSGYHLKNGKLVLNVNKNGSVDVGMHQINNQIWEKKARDLGYDIYTEEGNLKMAQWLLANYGSEPWVWTRPCFNR